MRLGLFTHRSVRVLLFDLLLRYGVAALLLAEEGFHVLLCGAEFTQFDLRFLVAGVEPVFLRGKGLIFGIQLFEEMNMFMMK